MAMGAEAMNEERRRAPRYQLIADAEVTELQSGTRLRAKTGDLSLGGCFLDMLNPPPEGTLIQVTIRHANNTFTAFGKVVFLFPNLGMGVVFTRVRADQSEILQEWVSELSHVG